MNIIQNDEVLSDYNFFHLDGNENLLVFIHGITGDSKKTWFNEHTNFCFPKELAEDLDNTTILSFGYQNTKFGNDIHPFMVLQDYIKILNTIIQKYSFKKVFFVAHSMGGLFTKALLTHDEYNFADLTDRIILLATPNNGNAIASFISWFYDNSQLSFLGSIHNNGLLQNIWLGWESLYGKNGSASNSINCYCGYETKKTKLKIIVDLGSVITHCDQIEPFEKNHITISKPRDKTDKVYIWVKNKLSEKLSHLEILSKKSLQVLYRHRVEELESKVKYLEESLFLKTNMDKLENLPDEFSEYISLSDKLESEKTLISEFIDYFHTNIYKHEANDVMTVIKLIEEGKLEDAYDYFKTDDIEKDISEIIKQKEKLEKLTKNTIKKLQIKIYLSRLLNQFDEVQENYNQLLLIDMSIDTRLNYAVFLQSIGQYLNAFLVYKELIDVEMPLLKKAKILNNIGGLANFHIFTTKEGLLYLSKSKILYENLLRETQDDELFINYIETCMNLYVLEYVDNRGNAQKSINKLVDLKTKVLNHKNMTDDYAYKKLHLQLISNTFGVIIENVDIYNPVFNIEEEIKTFTMIIENIQKENALDMKIIENITKMYFNQGSYYGLLYKEYLSDKYLDQADYWFNKVIIILSKINKNTSVDNHYIATIFRNLGVLHADGGQKEIAEKYYNEALKILENLLEIDQKHFAIYFEEIFSIYLDLSTLQNNDELSDKYLNKAQMKLDIIANNGNRYDLDYARLYMTYALHYMRINNLEMKNIFIKKAQDILDPYDNNEARSLLDIVNKIP